MHQRFAAGKHDPPHAQGFYVARVTLQFIHTDFLHGVDFPDVAHHAAAIAAVVGIQDKNRQGFEYVRFGHVTSEYHGSRGAGVPPVRNEDATSVMVGTAMPRELPAGRDFSHGGRGGHDFSRAVTDTGAIRNASQIFSDATVWCVSTARP